MKIAHVTATYPPYYGGTGRVCREQATVLMHRGHDVAVYTVAYSGHTVIECETPRVVRFAPQLVYGNAALILQQLWMDKPDLLHLHYPFYGGGDCAWLGAVMRHIPYVVTYHQDVALPGITNVIVLAHHATMGRAILHRARVIMPTSADYAASSRLAPMLSRQSSRVIPLPLGVDTERFHPMRDRAEQRAALGWSTYERIVLFVGALDCAHFFKGVRVLLEAVRLLAQPETRLVIVGRGNLLPAYRTAAQELDIAARVTFADSVEDRDLPVFYRAADVTVLPSVTRGEAFGVVLLESLASGTPVVASDIPGVRSVVAATGGGLLVKPGDATALAHAIGRVLGDSRLAGLLSARGTAAISRLFTWPHIIDRLEEVYERALQEA
ncbi:MAG: glycosyltransferase family 4 protein [Chloroflexi bacterium]|nr:glycosyltransferase family 4 protein [Chloroflexota bacterium]